MSSELFSSQLLILTNPYHRPSSGSTTFNKGSACGKHRMIYTHCPQADFSNIGNVTDIQKMKNLFQPHSPTSDSGSDLAFLCLYFTLTSGPDCFNSPFCNFYLLQSIMKVLVDQRALHSYAMRIYTVSQICLPTVFSSIDY